MSNGKKEMPWYQREYEEMLREHQSVGGAKAISFKEMLQTYPKPKLSHVLQCVRMAKEQPGVFEEARTQALLSKEVWDDEERRPSPLLPFFADWYRFKHGLQDHLSHAFMIDPILRSWAHPDFDGDEVAALKRVIQHPWETYVDDLTEEQPEREEKQ